MRPALPRGTTHKIPRSHWTISQQVFESNLIEFGLDKEVAALATAYVGHCSNFLSFKGAEMILTTFKWEETEEGLAYWSAIYEKARTIEAMWDLMKPEEPNV